MAYDVPADVIETDDVGMETLNKMLGSVRAVAHAAFPLGGSKSDPHPGTSAQAVVGAVPFVLPDAASGGAQYKVRVFCLTGNVATEITPKLRQISGTPADLWTGSACSGTAANLSGTGQHQLSTALSLVVGEIYELWASKNNDTNPAWVVGYLERADG